MKTFLSPVVGAAMASFMLSAHADFIDDSHADVTLLNRYLNQQGRDVVGSSAKATAFGIGARASSSTSSPATPRERLALAWICRRSTA